MHRKLRKFEATTGCDIGRDSEFGKGGQSFLGWGNLGDSLGQTERARNKNYSPSRKRRAAPN